jgi:tetratricopeptide (TPR) repeat protein
VQTIPLRDERGNTNVHYLVRLKRPDDFTIQQNNDGRWYYSASVVVKVFSPEKKLIFTQQRALTNYLSNEELERNKTRAFGYEGILPLPAGKYQVEFLLTNKLKNTSFRAEKEVVVPAIPENGVRLSDIVPFTDASVAAGNDIIDQPFQAANVKFSPDTAQELVLAPGQPLMFFYQIWTKPADPKSYGDATLIAEYAYGRMGLHDTKTVVDEFKKGQFNNFGAMVNGKKIDTMDLEPGNYRLSVTLTDPAWREKAFASLSFRIAAGSPGPSSWDVVDPELLEFAKKGVFDYERALCYLSQGNTMGGVTWLESAFQKNSDDEAVRTKLVDSLFSRQDFKQVVATYDRSAITAKTDEQTILRIAESFDKLGQPEKSVAVLESAVTLKPQSGPLYLSLAGYYHRLGNMQKASEMENKGRSLVVSSAPTGS